MGKDESFKDLYEFLGIPASASSELVELAIHKIEVYLEQHGSTANNSILTDLRNDLALAEDILRDHHQRTVYNQQWRQYYFPQGHDGSTNVALSQTRSSHSTILWPGLRSKSGDTKANPGKRFWLGDGFNYQQDFYYLLVIDTPENTQIKLLEAAKQHTLPGFKEVLEFQGRQFYLQTEGDLDIEVYNDAMGKRIAVHCKSEKIALHIGDRIRCDQEEKFVLRGFYMRTLMTPQAEIPALGKLFRSRKGIQPLALYCPESDQVYSLDPAKITVVGRNSSSLAQLFPSDKYLFIDMGHGDLTISRQNFQIFAHRGNFYIQDLGSRFGTTLDLEQHFKLETLVGGAIMGLESGTIRIGKKKDQLIYIGPCKKIAAQRSSRSITQIQSSPDAKTEARK